MTRILRRPLLSAAVAGLAVIALGASAVIGATVATNGGSVTAAWTKTATDPIAVGGTQLAEMTLSVTVPAGQRAIFVITFSAQTQCFAPADAGPKCFIQTLFDGSEARPGVVTINFSDGATAQGYEEANSMQFVAGPAGPGTHYIRVRFSGTLRSTLLLGPRTLTVLRSQV